MKMTESQALLSRKLSDEISANLGSIVVSLIINSCSPYHLKNIKDMKACKPFCIIYVWRSGIKTLNS